MREDDAWVSHPDLPGLLAAQAAAADDVGIPFINAFDLMGGRGSAAQWALTTPPLIEPDREHLTPQGAKRFEAALWPALQAGGQRARESRRPSDEAPWAACSWSCAASSWPSCG